MLIQNDLTLRKFLPNALATCEGEATLYDKLDFYLAGAERWLADNVTGTDLLVTISAKAETEPIRLLCAQIVACHAMYSAVPSLDLVLTPNGFGIVNNGNIVPASADRVKSLRDTLIANRDEYLQQLLLLLSKDSSWRESEQGKVFGSTLFPTLELCKLMGKTTELWRNYRPLRQQLVLIEDELAEKYISEEIYKRFREHAQSGAMTAKELPLVEILRAIELELLSGKALDYPRIISVVERLRSNPTDFPEWRDSATAMLFCRPAFHNEKSSSGYWW